MPPQKPRCRDAPWFFLAREGLSARPEWARNRRWTMPCNVSVRGAFQLTPSARRATRSRPFGPAMPENFNPRPPRGGRPGGGLKNAFTVFISIHALREEGDAALTIFFSLWAISIHALREESDNPAGCSQQPARYFNPRPPRGERQCDDHAPEAPETISIHALRGESDHRRCCCSSSCR